MSNPKDLSMMGMSLSTVLGIPVNVKMGVVSCVCGDKKKRERCREREAMVKKSGLKEEEDREVAGIYRAT